jgi:uncharacterized membrane protein YkoI
MPAPKALGRASAEHGGKVWARKRGKYPYGRAARAWKPERPAPPSPHRPGFRFASGRGSIIVHESRGREARSAPPTTPPEGAPMSHARRIAVVAGVLAVAACSQTQTAPSAAKAEEQETQLDVREVAAEQKAPLADAIAAALARSPGEAIEAGIEGEVENGKREVFIEVMVIDAHGEAIEVKVGAADGKVLSASKSDEEDETPELMALLKRLPAGHLSLGDLARRAAVGAEGKMVLAAFAAKKGADAVAVVRFLVGKELRQVTLDPRTGAVLTRKTLPKEEEEDEEEENEKGEMGEKGEK